MLNKVSSSESDLHVQAGLQPNDQDGTSAIAFCTPSMCNGVNGHACMVFRQRARTWTRCSATTDLWDARQVTQLTVGELSLNNVTCFSLRTGHTPSMTIQSKTKPAISRSEFVTLPAKLETELMSCLMSLGHSQWKTTGVHADCSPNTTLPVP